MVRMVARKGVFLDVHDCEFSNVAAVFIVMEGRWTGCDTKTNSF